MLTRTITTAFVAIALPCLAAQAQSTEHQKLAAALDLDASGYSYSQLVQISNETSHDGARARRIEIIDAQNRAFHDAVVTAMRNGGISAVTVSTSN